MFFSIGLLILIVLLAFKIAPREKIEDIKVHGAGQIDVLAAIGAALATLAWYLTIRGRGESGIVAFTRIVI